ncbi:42430_t:CDS:1, partial [Gigaspora margarita]
KGVIDANLAIIKICTKSRKQDIEGQWGLHAPELISRIKYSHTYGTELRVITFFIKS